MFGHGRGNPYRWRRRHRRLPRLPRRLPRFLAVLAVWLMVAPAATYLVSGSATILTPPSTPSATSSPSAAPYTDTNPQGAAASPSASAPSGTAEIQAQTRNGTASTAVIASLPAATAQSANGALTNVQPNGTLPQYPQLQIAHFISGSPPAPLPPAAGYYQSSFSVDTDQNGTADTVNYILVDRFGNDGKIDSIFLSLDMTYGEGFAGDTVVSSGNDESFYQDQLPAPPSFSQGIRLGDRRFQVTVYTEVVYYPISPWDSSSYSGATITAIDRFTGTVRVDMNADGDTLDDADIVSFVLSDTDSDGRYDTLELSTDDGPLDSATFGEGTLSGQSPRQTGNNDDERLTLGTGGGNDGGSADVRLGPYYLFTVAFDNNPAFDAEDVRITARTRYDGNFVLDADANGSLAAGDDEKLFFVLSDLDSDGLYDTMDLSLGDQTFGQGSVGDAVVVVGNDAQITATTTLMVGATFNVSASFAANPAAATDDASILLVTSGGSPVAWTSLSSWLIDADGDEAANDHVFFVLTDTDSDGIVDTIDISIGDDVFGEGNFSDGEVDFSAANNSNDERFDLSAYPSGKVVKLGTHRFLVEFTTAVLPDALDAFITARWYEGSFLAEVNGSPETVIFVQVSPSSDGLYTVLEVDENRNGSYQPNEVRWASPATIQITNSSFSMTYRSNPTLSDSATVAPGASASPVSPVLDQTGSFTGANSLPASETLARAAEQAKREADAQDAPESTQPIPVQATEPPPVRVTRDINNQPLAGDEVVVVMSPDLPDAERRIRQIAFATGATFLGSVSLTRTYQLQFPVADLTALDRVIARLEGFTGVASASHHYLLDELARTPNDSQYPSWGEAAGDGWDLRAMRAPEAWDTITGNPSVRIAVIDADFDRNHEDLRDNVASISAPKRTKAGGHGTHVSGTICARGDNQVGVAGVVWDCSLSLYDFGGASPVKAQEAMIAAVQSGARIINMSLQWVDNNQCGTVGTPATSKKVEEVNNILKGGLDYAKRERRDVLWVFAAGNECRDTRYAAPASLVRKYPENVIVVSSIGPAGDLSYFSNYGDLVTVVAPGEDILSTLPSNDYGLLSGTSMATPHVSGLAALIMSRRPALSAAQVKQCITGSAGSSSRNHSYKLVNAAEAVRCTSAPPSPPRVYGGG
ncbi:MAG: S8 family serine peptidase [Chloroflexi bacterium]|nr:S8 family serine peptidase [Chloroflexota bacterium]